MTTETEVSICTAGSRVHGILHRHHQWTQLRVGMLGYRPLLVLLRVAQSTLICRGKVAFGKHLGVSPVGIQRYLRLLGRSFRGIVEQVIAEQIIAEQIIVEQIIAEQIIAE